MFSIYLVSVEVLAKELNGPAEVEILISMGRVDDVIGGFYLQIVLAFVLARDPLEDRLSTNRRCENGPRSGRSRVKFDTLTIEALIELWRSFPTG